jgi:regulation of enolase protein 1 (concanavalin A-like superfamily)
VRYATAYHPVPVWVRMTRDGNSFTASYSADGTNWTQVGSPRTVAMPADARVGLAVSSATSGLSTATFSDVTVTGENAWFTP